MLSVVSASPWLRYFSPCTSFQPLQHYLSSPLPTIVAPCVCLCMRQNNRRANSRIPLVIPYSVQQLWGVGRRMTGEVAEHSKHPLGIPTRARHHFGGRLSLTDTALCRCNNYCNTASFVLQALALTNPSAILMPQSPSPP